MASSEILRAKDAMNHDRKKRLMQRLASQWAISPVQVCLPD